jgi:hypothetical protein
VKKLGKICSWIVVIFFGLMAIAYNLTFAMVLALIALVLSLPIAPIDNIWNKVGSGRKIIKPIVLIVLFVLIMVAAPESTTTDSKESKNEFQGSESNDKEERTENASETLEQSENEDSTEDNQLQTNNLELFLLEINIDTAEDEIKSLAKTYGLKSDHKRTGTGKTNYRVAYTKDVANVNKKEKGSYISITYNNLKDDKMEEMVYFDEDKMVEGFWDETDGYSMIDYNNPQEYSDRVAIESFNYLIEYSPVIDSEVNALEELFCGVNEDTTKEKILAFVEEKGLSYNSRGAGNEQIIAYTRNVQDKYGDDGTYITFDLANEKLACIEYHEFAIQYRNGYYAAYYTKEYTYNDYEGYYLMSYNEDPQSVQSAEALIETINGMRKTK